MHQFWSILSLLCLGQLSLWAQQNWAQPELLRQVPDAFERVEEIHYEGQTSALHAYQYGTFFRLRRDYLLFISEHAQYRSGIYGVLDSNFQRVIRVEEVDPNSLEFVVKDDTSYYRPHHFIRPWPLEQDRARASDTTLRFPYITKSDTLQQFHVDGRLAGAMRFGQIGGERQLSDLYIRTSYEYFYGWHFAPYEKQGMYQRVPTRDSLVLVRVGLWDQKGFANDRERMYYLNGKLQGLYWKRRGEEEVSIGYYQLGEKLFSFSPLRLRPSLSPYGHPLREQLVNNSWTITANTVEVLPYERDNYIAWQGEVPLPEKRVKYLRLGANGYLKYRDSKTSEWQEGSWRLIRTEDDKLTLAVEQIDTILYYQITWSSPDFKQLVLLGLPSDLVEE